ITILMYCVTPHNKLLVKVVALKTCFQTAAARKVAITMAASGMISGDEAYTGFDFCALLVPALDTETL
ncbi:hypothetical protein L9F63_021061, partial [Diploptera punctata]